MLFLAAGLRFFEVEILPLPGTTASAEGGAISNYYFVCIFLEEWHVFYVSLISRNPPSTIQEDSGDGLPWHNLASSCFSSSSLLQAQTLGPPRRFRSFTATLEGLLSTARAPAAASLSSWERSCP
jgi:hypothetical protein